MGEDNGGEGGRVFRNNYKGHMDKTKEACGSRGGRWGWLQLGGEVGGGKYRQLYSNNNKIIFLKRGQTAFFVVRVCSSFFSSSSSLYLDVMSITQQSCDITKVITRRKQHDKDVLEES